MLESESDPWKPILNLFVTAGYIEARNKNVSTMDMLAGGLAWCISATKAVGSEFELLSNQDFTIQEDKIKVGEAIGEALRSMGCPYSFQAHQIQDLDYGGVYPVVQWVVDRVLTMQAETKDEIEKEEQTIQQLEKELNQAKISTNKLCTDLNEQNQTKSNILNGMQHLYVKIDEAGASDVVQRLMLQLESLKALERQESDSRSYCDKKKIDLQSDVIELEKKISSREKTKSNSDDFEHSLCDPLERLNSAKREHASKLRAVILLKRRIDDVPSQSELIQYERRFSELYVQIQEKLQQTRKFYATYNALLEIKDLVLKETSLLNSISSQFQDAMTSTSGRMKLIDSMEGIVKGTKQKLGKVQLGLQAEQKTYDALKEKYAASIAEQRRCSSLLKAFQEEYAKNERLQSQTST